MLKRVVERVTGAVAIAKTIAPGKPWQLEEMRIHLSAVGGAGNLTATMDAEGGVAYDNVLHTVDMSAQTDVTWQPTRPRLFAKGDELDFAWPNAGGKTYGMEIIYSIE